MRFARSAWPLPGMEEESHATPARPERPQPRRGRRFLHEALRYPPAQAQARLRELRDREAAAQARALREPGGRRAHQPPRRRGLRRRRRAHRDRPAQGRRHGAPGGGREHLLLRHPEQGLGARARGASLGVVSRDRGLRDLREVKLGEATVRSILTRTTGYLRAVTSHSLQPYRGCSFGGALCGVGCYVRASPWLTRGETWGGFLEARTNAAVRYREQAPRERRWARRARGGFGVFLSSSTDPFVPQERSLGVTRRVLEAMCDEPPDELVVQTHTHRVTDYLDLYPRLAKASRVRFH